MLIKLFIKKNLWGILFFFFEDYFDIKFFYLMVIIYDLKYLLLIFL